MLWGPIGGLEVELSSFFNLGARWEWVINATPLPFTTPPPRDRDPVPIVQEAGWAPGPVWTRVENLAPLSGFDPRAFQRRCTDWAIPTHVLSTLEKSSQEAVQTGGRTYLSASSSTSSSYSWSLMFKRNFVRKLFVMLKSVFEPRTSSRILRVWVLRRSSAFATHAGNFCSDSAAMTNVPVRQLVWC